ncbi:MAG: NAD(+) synthase [Defluviitaleaceae bacterium]|nr:NAD(+) synthase [Defluviitaleaceae bacterium]
MRDYKAETEQRVSWIRETLEDSGARGIIFGNSGGKDSALVGILCRQATENVLGVMMPCGTKVNYSTDIEHAKLLADAFAIKNTVVELTPGKDALLQELGRAAEITPAAAANINPRLRMATLYTFGQSLGYIVAGTGNASERHIGYFTKWGDGAFDFNPIADLTATEVLDFLQHLGAPAEITNKPPSAGLYEGQTDETDIGLTYAALDKFIQTGEGQPADIEKINRMHKQSMHKRQPPKIYH